MFFLDDRGGSRGGVFVGVLALVVLRRVCERDQDRGLCGKRDLGDGRSPGARDDEVGKAVGAAHLALFEETGEVVERRAAALKNGSRLEAYVLEVLLPGLVDHLAAGDEDLQDLDHRLVDGAGALRSSGYEDHRPLRKDPEGLARLIRIPAEN